jgi:hypothetical protein
MGKVSNIMRQKYEVHVLRYNAMRTLKLKGGKQHECHIGQGENIIGMTHGG